MLIDRSKTSWNEDLGLGVFRAQKTPTLKGNKKRLRAYQAGLTQSEDLWKAANGLSALSSPLLRFYALLQASSSVIAASALGHDQWQPRGSHGLTLTGLPQKETALPALGSVSIKPSGRGTPQVLAEALGSGFLESSVSLEDLIAALPEQSLVQPGAPKRFPVHVEIQSSPIPGPLVVMRGLIDDDYLSGFKAGQDEIPERAIRAAFASYPSLETFPSWDRAVVASEYPPGPPFSVEFGWTNARWNAWQLLGEHVDIWDSTMGAFVDKTATVFPALGGSRTAQHPLVTWYLVLYAFSMIARYHPGEWRLLLDKDKSPTATHLERLIDVDAAASITLVGGVLLHFIRDSHLPEDDA